MARFDDELTGVPPERRDAARTFLRVDHGLGRLRQLWIAGVLALGALVFYGFALLELITDGAGSAVRSCIVPTILLTAAIVVATRPSRRFTEVADHH